jgi:hypothetical protein
MSFSMIRFGQVRYSINAIMPKAHSFGSLLMALPMMSTRPLQENPVYSDQELRLWEKMEIAKVFISWTGTVKGSRNSV